MKKIKNLFSTPKKAIISVICIIAILAALCIGGAFIARAAVESSSIGMENAKNFAFADAGIDPAAAKIVHTEFDFEQGKFVYEIEFTADGTEYDYWIKASDGSIVKKEEEIVSPNGKNIKISAKITMDKAKEIALADAGLSQSDVTFTAEKLDSDNGISVYDIDFSSSNVKYEYEINAETGNIYSKSKETLAENRNTADNSINQQSGSNKNSSSLEIGLDGAKNKALNDAGLSNSDVTFTKEKLDYDDGTAVYDIEFYTNDKEYDYEINASTGDIINRDVDIFRGSGNSGNAAADNGKANSGSYIGIDKAKAIAVEHAGFSVSEVNFSKAKLDNDDGYTVYEIDFYKNGTEYEYTVNALTGTIIEYDSDWD